MRTFECLRMRRFCRRVVHAFETSRTSRQKARHTIHRYDNVRTDMPYEAQTRATQPSGQSKPASVPGGWQAAAIAALSALLIRYWAKQSHSELRADERDNVSRVTDVSPQDLPGALDTVAGTPRQLAQFRDHDACSRRLAWVTLVRAPGQPPGRIRLRSGSYISPAFELLETPVRVAFPYPAPYATGHGVISVIGATAAAVVALTPPWHVPAQAGVEVRKVNWTPGGVCPGIDK